MRGCSMRLFAVSSIVLAIVAHGYAQIGQVQTGLTANADNLTPTPGAGHDYVHMLSETVNPANGAVDITVGFGAPPSRGISLPAAYVYDSNRVYSLMQDPTSNTIEFEQPYSVGQNDSFPVATWSESSYQPPNVVEGTGGTTVVQPACNYALDFTFRGPDGVSHNVPLAVVATALNDQYSGNGSCSAQTLPSTAATDGVVTGAFVYPSTTLSDVSEWTINYHDSPGPIGSVGEFTITDPAGTTYFFDGGNGAYIAGGVFEEYAYMIEDRNGNTITNSGCGSPSTIMYCDTAGRPIELLTANGVTVGGISYSISTGTAGHATVNYEVPQTKVQPAPPNSANIGCPTPTDWTVPATNAALTAPIPRELTITVQTSPPTSYTLYFGDYNPMDSSVENPYGLINQIVYPDGGWVKYTWTLPTAYTQAATFAGQYLPPSTLAGQEVSYGCSYEYATPEVLTRQVSNDGSSVARSQTFTYSTNWATGDNAGTWISKSTTVNTTDEITNRTAQTLYTYQPGYLAVSSSVWGSVAPEVPLEQTIARFDWGNTTAPLDTETKGWFTNTTYVPQLACDFHTLNTGKSTGDFYQYSSVAPSQVSDEKEYDFGQIASPATACAGSNPTAPSGVTPIREIVTGYQSFTSPLSPAGPIFVKPSSVVTKGNGARIAETDYSYDLNTLTPVTAVNHDPNFGPALQTNRGNATSITRQCIGCTSATSTYSYDETGQVATVIDPCGYSSCSDMSGSSTHKTTYSFTDSPAGGDSYGNSNAYVTSVIDALGYSTSYQYNYTSGELTSSTDENKNVTAYCYTVGGCSGSVPDALNRITGVTYPDSGWKIMTYSDGPPNPVVQTQKGINASTTMTTENVMDGMGNVVEALTNSDPYGQVESDTIYDGMGRVFKLSNPYRPSAGSANYIISTYDSLGRTVTQTQADTTSVLYWCYNGVASSGQQNNCLANQSSLTNTSWIDYSDEAGNHWQRSYDGLSRLVGVMEPNSSNVPAMETDYLYDALGDMLSSAQHGVAGGGTVTRTFSYDSIGRLVGASNPETGLVCYGTMTGGACQGAGYDANGNLSEKTDARGVVTNYFYDGLNRLMRKAYSNDASDSPSSCYLYDLSSVTNAVGRLTNEWTQSASVGPCASSPPSSGILTRRSITSYDPMGRVWSETQCTPANCTATGTAYSLSYLYDFAGDLTYTTNGISNTPGTSTPLAFTSLYDGAERLQALTSNWDNNSSHPSTMFSVYTPSSTPCGQTAPYAAFGGLQNAMLGTNLMVERGYDSRLRVNCESDTGSAASATGGSATITITGAEQN